MSWIRRMTRDGPVTSWGGQGGPHGAVLGVPAPTWPTPPLPPPGAHEEVDYTEKLKFSDEEDGKDSDEEVAEEG